MSDARRSACHALVELEKGRQQRLDDALNDRKLGPADRRLARELAWGVERNLAFLDAVAQALAKRGLPRDPMQRVALRLGAYQILFLTRIPPHAAVHATVGLLSVRHGRAFANAILRRLSTLVERRPADPAAPRREIPLDDDRTLVLPHDALPDPTQAPNAYLALRYSIPEFLVDGWAAQHGPDVAAQLARAASRTPAVWLRARSAEGAPALAAALAEHGVETEPGAHRLSLRWSGGTSPFATPLFQYGRFVAQDPTALAVTEAVGAKSGEVVLDLCAAPGTKATALAEAVAPDGCVFAWDINAARRERIVENAQRLGLDATLRVVDPSEVTRPVDAVLVDVPCSNTGVLARRVEVRRRLTPASIAELAALQRELLGQAMRAVRPGGRVVYSTCSIEPAENQDVVAVAAEGGFELQAQELILPDPPAHDGGFYAVLRAPR